MGTLLQLTLSQLKGVGWAALVSIGLHGALAFAFLRAPIGMLGAATRPPEPVTITILEEPSEPPIEPEERVDVPPEPPPLPEEATSEPQAGTILPGLRERDLDPERDEDEPTGGDEVSVVEVPTVEPEQTDRPPQETDEERRRRLAVLLDPSGVARRGYEITGPGPSQRGRPAGLGRGRDRGPSERDIERSLSSGLRADAMTKNHTTRERVVPRRQADGSYRWDGHAFAAIIRPDGEVDFQDRPNVQTDGFSTSGSFDLTDAIMGGSGQDPYAAERARFMRETRELRERLEAEHRRHEMARGIRQLRGRLTRVWATTSRSTAARRRRIFQIWDEIAEDGSAGDARRLVIAFIRETIPEGSEDAYTDAEIDALNARRESRERFDPY